MSFVAVAIGTTIVGGTLGYLGASQQADAASGAAANQSAAANYAAQLQYQEFLQTQQQMQPWRQVGQGGLNQLAMMMGIPGYYQQPGQSQGQGGQGQQMQPSQGQGGQPAGQTGQSGQTGQQYTLQQLIGMGVPSQDAIRYLSGDRSPEFLSGSPILGKLAISGQIGASNQNTPILGPGGTQPGANGANATPETWKQFMQQGGINTPSNLGASWKAFLNQMPANEAAQLRPEMQAWKQTQDPYSGKTWGDTISGSNNLTPQQLQTGWQSFLSSVPADQRAQYQQQMQGFMGSQAPSDPGNYMASQNPQFGALTKPFDYQQSPGYQWQLQQGQQAVEATQAAGGKFFSGSMGEALQGYSQGLAQQDYGNAFNQWLANNTQTYNELAGISGTGQIAAQQIGQAGQQYAQNAGNFLTNGAYNAGQLNQNAANATAGGYQNMFNQGMGGLSAYNNYNMYSNMGGGGYGNMNDPNAWAYMSV